MKFTHLHVHSHYSLLDGLAKIDDLVSHAKEMGFSALALTDHGTMYGIPEFYQKAKKAGLKPILGAEIYLAVRTRFDKEPNIDSKRYHLTLLAKNYTGYKNLMKIVSKSNLEGFYYKPRADKQLLKEHSEGIIALSGCLSGELSRLVIANQFDVAEKKLEEYKEIFGDDFYIELGYHPGIDDSLKAKKELIKLAKKHNTPLVATYDTHYLKPEDSEAHDVLLAVGTGKQLGQPDRLSMKGVDFSLCPQSRMEELYGDIPEALENTEKIAEMCDVEIPMGETILPHFSAPSQFKDNTEYFVHLCEKGLEKRFGDNISKEILDRFNYELEIIKKTGFIDYFLLVQDFINWAKENDIFVGPGRGSAAGSLISYLLKITDIDPIKYGLLFERFLNPERISMPDIDIDFGDTDRDKVLAHLQEKHGKNHVCQIITFGTMKSRAAIRDTGRALGMSYGFCDSLAKLIPFNTNLDKSLEMVSELKTRYDSEPDVKKLIDFSKKLEGVARHASVHACGAIITKGELTDHVPVQRAPQNNDSVITQYDMRVVEDLGLLKMDLLGIRTLTVIKETIEIVEAVKGEKIDITNIPLDDPKTYELFRKAQTVGIFQLESGGMRRYLKELKPTELEDIIVILSLYRPGPIEVIPTYIARKHGKEKVTYPHPQLEPILKSTYGVMVYQEQLLKLARDFAGFSYREADVLRKAVGKKIKSLLDEQREKLIDGMIKNNIPQKTAEKVWVYIEPFAQYGFNRSHSVSYAMIAYQTAYLKANYPLEFMAALMNNEATETEKTAQLISECKSMKIPVLPPDINESFKKFTVVEEKGAIRFGLQAIKNVGSEIAKAIIKERKAKGNFKDIKEFLDRIEHKDLNKKSLESLIKAGAFDSLAERGELFNNLEELLRYNQDTNKAKSNPQVGLFGQEMSFSPLKIKKTDPLSIEEKLAWERELLGLFISGHPLEKYKEAGVKYKATPIENIDKKTIGKKILVLGLVSEIKNIITKRGEAMLIAKLEDLTGSIEITVFPQTLEKTVTNWQKDNIILVEGRADKNNGEIKITCERVASVRK